MPLAPSRGRPSPLRAAWLAARCFVAIALTGCVPEPAPPRADHLVLVVYDTLRSDRMSIYGHDRPTTPFLQSVAGELVLYRDVKAPASWTLPSHVSIFTGLLPSEHGAHWGHKRLDPELTTLAEVLQREGFCTFALSANPIVNQKFGFGQGFDRYRKFGRPDDTRTARLLRYLPRFLDEVEERGCRMFLFINLMDAHTPFNVSDHGAAFGADGPGPIADTATKWRVNAGLDTLSPTQLDRNLRAYDAAVRTLDDATFRLFDLLRSRALLDASLVALTSDHGEGLGEHGTFGHVLSIWEGQLAVPLLIRHPRGIGGGIEVGGPRSLAQLPASLLEWLEIPVPADMARRPSLGHGGEAPADYRSYFDPAFTTNARMAELYPDLARRTGHAHVTYCPPHKLFVRSDRTVELYDLGSDPAEARDVSAENPVALRACVGRYRELLADGAFTPFDSTLTSDPQPLSESELRDLRDLGYLQ